MALLSLMLVGLVTWNLYKGCFRNRFSENSGAGQVKKPSDDYMQIQNNITSEFKLLGPTPSHSANKNQNAIIAFKGNGEHHFSPGSNISTVDGLGYIDDESEI